MTKTVSLPLIGFLNSQIASTREKHKSALSEYARATVHEKMAKYHYENDDSSGNLVILTASIIRAIEVAGSLKESEQNYSDALRALSSVKKPIQHRELWLDHHITALQTKLEHHRGIFQSKLLLLKSGRKSLAKRMSHIVKTARVYYKLAFRQQKNFKTLESTLKSLLMFETNAGLQAKLQQTTQSVITSKQDLKEARRDLEQFIKLAKRHGFDVDFGHVLNDELCGATKPHESDRASADESDCEPESDNDSDNDTKNKADDHDSDHDSEKGSDSDSDKDSDKESESESESESEIDSESESDEEACKNTRTTRNHKSNVSSSTCDAIRTPTLTDYITNNPFDFYAKFIQPRIPQSSMNNALDLLRLLNVPPANNQSTHCKKSFKKNRHSSRARK